jgi:hypothetical protein
MSEKSEGIKRIEKRLEEEERQEQEHVKEFPRFAKGVVEGTLTEDAVIRAKDGKKYCVTIHALGEGEILEALDECELEIHEIGSQAKAKANMKFQHAICAKSIGDMTPAEFANKVTFGQSAKLTQKILVLSNILSSAQAMSSFRQV